jgi:hypothetical protein
VVSLHALKVLMQGYELPDAFNQLLVKPWMNIANTLLELNGVLSDTWVRMLWFTRTVCNSISTSITSRDPEPLEKALHTFMIWLQVCNQETGSLDLELVAAQQLCNCLRTQLLVDLGGNDFSAVINAVPAPGTSEAATPREERQPLHESRIQLGEDHQLVAAAQPAREGRLIPEIPENIPESIAKAPESAITQNPTEGSNSQEQSVTIDSQETLNAVEPQPPIDHSKLNQHNLNATFITMSQGETLMDNLEDSQSSHAPVDKMSEVNTAVDTMQLTKRSLDEWSKSLLVPIGIWLGFHDGEVSTMIRLAVYDRANDNYIFANKQGFLVRQINTPDLLHLIDNELVDIVERRRVPRKTAA